MRVLALDSCASACGVCVWEEGRVLATAREQMERGQDARLLPMIVAVLEKAKLEFADLDRIAVTRGPGSFTGVRVGLAAARGIALAAQKTLMGIDRFAVYRTLGTAGKDILVVIESKRAELFCRFFPMNGEAHEARLMSQDEIEAFKAARPGLEIIGDIATPDKDILAICAKLAAEADPNDPDFRPLPLYLREADVTLPKAR